MERFRRHKPRTFQVSASGAVNSRHECISLERQAKTIGGMKPTTAVYSIMYILFSCLLWESLNRPRDRVIGEGTYGAQLPAQSLTDRKYESVVAHEERVTLPRRHICQLPPLGYKSTTHDNKRRGIYLHRPCCAFLQVGQPRHTGKSV